jgi:hypothetical protein
MVPSHRDTESATETILPRKMRGKGEKLIDAFCSRDKRLQSSPSGDRGAW